MYKLFPNHLDCAAVMHFSMMYLNKNCVSQMEILTRTINDTVSKVVDNVMETKINPSIEKSIKDKSPVTVSINRAIEIA